MSTHRLDLFWRDVEARCFTTLYFQAASQPQAQSRAQSILKTLAQLSRLQIYGAALDTLPLALTPEKAAPSNGTDTRLEIELYPAAPLKPHMGIEYIKFSIPGPTSESAQAVMDKDSTEWQSLEEEILPLLCLSNSATVQIPLQIKRSEVVQLSEERRPKPDRAPLSAAIESTTDKVEGLKQRLAHQPTARLYASMVKNQARLAHLQALASIEEQFFSAATLQPAAVQPSAAVPLEAVRALVAKQTVTEKASFMADKETPAAKAVEMEKAHLPCQTTSEEWSDVQKEEFFDPSFWLHRNQLKEIYEIPNDRAYFRWLEKLRQNGLARSLPAKDNGKVVLFYRKDLERALEKTAQAASQTHRGRPSKIGLPEIQPPQPAVPSQPATSLQSDRRPEAVSLRESPAPIPVVELAQIWSALSEIKSAQAALQAQQDALTARLDSLTSTVEALPKAQEQFLEVINFHQLNSQLSSLMRRMDSRLKKLGDQPAKAAKAKTKAKAKAKKKALSKRKSSIRKKPPTQKAKSAAEKKTAKKARSTARKS